SREGQGQKGSETFNNPVSFEWRLWRRKTGQGACAPQRGVFGREVGGHRVEITQFPNGSILRCSLVLFCFGVDTAYELRVLFQQHRLVTLTESNLHV
ncbi:MAG: hypothetical protein ACLGIP_18890, partial [Alphaproteobacteria bacterium]